MGGIGESPDAGLAPLVEERVLPLKLKLHPGKDCPA
jgi:hypothetical protein